MKVVSVYTGSLVIDYTIEPDSDTSSADSAAALRSITSSLTELVTTGSEAFGAPILSASTDGSVTVEDPTYNPAARQVVDTTPVIVESVQPAESTDTVTISDDGLTLTVEEVTRNSLIGILVVIVLLGTCCFGIGALIICTYKLTKAARQITDV